MIYDNIEDMKTFGMEGFISIDTLMMYECSQVPRQMGIYLVLNNDQPADFLHTNYGGHFKGKDPTIQIDKLKSNWVNETQVLYIGKAGGGTSKATLQKRLKQYMRFGEGDPVGHWGGRLIWQLGNNRNFLIAWKRLILSHHKNLNSGAFLIDDREENGASNFPGEHLHFGLERKYPTWDSVLESLRKNS